MITKEEKREMLEEMLSLKRKVQKQSLEDEENFKNLYAWLKLQNPDLEEDDLWDYIWNDFGYIDNLILP